MRCITFTLPFAYALPNVTLCQNRWRATRDKNDLMRQVMAVANHLRPSHPFQKACVEIERHGSGSPDPDNLVGGCKRLLDCLTTPVQLNSKKGRVVFKNKRGLGFIVDDSPDRLALSVRAVRCKRGEEKTVVTITEME